MAGFRSQRESWNFDSRLFLFSKEIMSDFEYTTSGQQIKKLKGQHLIIEDERGAQIALQTYGYYNIINGYRHPYIIRTYEGKVYCPDTTFGQIFGLFSLDHLIRNAVMNSMVDLEEHLRATVAEVIGGSFGTDYHVYLERNKYRDRRGRNAQCHSTVDSAKGNGFCNSCQFHKAI